VGHMHSCKNVSQTATTSFLHVGDIPCFVPVCGVQLWFGPPVILTLHVMIRQCVVLLLFIDDFVVLHVTNKNDDVADFSNLYCVIKVYAVCHNWCHVTASKVIFEELGMSPRNLALLVIF